jgi:hypothetical protein
MFFDMASSSLLLRSRKRRPWRSEWLVKPLPRAHEESLHFDLFAVR